MVCQFHSVCYMSGQDVSLVPAECVCNIRNYHQWLSILYPYIFTQMLEGANEIRQIKVNSFINIILPLPLKSIINFYSSLMNNADLATYKYPNHVTSYYVQPCVAVHV